MRDKFFQKENKDHWCPFCASRKGNGQHHRSKVVLKDGEKTLI